MFFPARIVYTVYIRAHSLFARTTYYFVRNKVIRVTFFDSITLTCPVCMTF